MSYFKKAASLLFNKRYLLVTNTFSNGILMGVGDISIQLFERRSSGNSDKDGIGIDWHRTGIVDIDLLQNMTVKQSLV